MATTRVVTPEDAMALETLIDRTSVSAVLESLGEICSEKAEHIRENWQDTQLARDWDAMALQMGLAHRAIARLEGR